MCLFKVSDLRYDKHIKDYFINCEEYIIFTNHYKGKNILIKVERCRNGSAVLRAFLQFIYAGAIV